MLTIGLLFSFWGDYLVLNGDMDLDIYTTIGLETFLTAFKVVAGVWLYKNIVGLDKFENSEGFSLKRKK